MNILVVGCSYSAECGFVDPIGKVWHHYIPKIHNVTNLSVGGNSNYKIFIKTYTELLSNGYYDLVLIQWSAIHRLSLNNGLSIYDNPQNFTLCKPANRSFKKFYADWVNNFIHTRIELSEFLSLISSLSYFLNSKKIPYVFIKGVDNFFSDLNFNDWKQCSDKFLDSVLYRNQLPDWEINEFYYPLHNQFVLMKELSKTKWLNLTDKDWYSSRIDLADDELHPGIKTNELFYNQVNNFIKLVGIYL